MFLKNTYVYNVDVSPPVGSALEVALVTFAKNLETSLIFIIWNIVRKQGSHGTGLSLGPGSQSTCSMGQSVNQRTENPCLRPVVLYNHPEQAAPETIAKELGQAPASDIRPPGHPGYLSC